MSDRPPRQSRSGGGRPPSRGGGRNDRGRNERGRTDRDGRGRGPVQPRTEAERRAAEVKARRAPRVPRDPADEAARIEARTVEEWIDEGSIRSEAEAATGRAVQGGSRGTSRESSSEALDRVDPEVASELVDAVGDRRAERLLERLSDAASALDRDRLDEARRLVTPLVRELPGVAAVHEVAGLVNYRLGRWKQAVSEIEAALALRTDVTLLPVLADSYRALRRWHDVDRVWKQVKAASPPHEVMTEARIVVAGSLADRGEIKEAISLLEDAGGAPKRVRDHHLRQWYALADLYDRAGDTVSAGRWFRAVAQRDPQFVDVTDRLRALGR
jgi:tetratricopeptide (TPR) repeat protein